MTAPPTHLDVLIAEFERSRLGELKLHGPDFQLHLRRGRKPQWKATDPQQSGSAA